MGFRDRLGSGRFFAFVTVNILGCCLVVTIVARADQETLRTIASIALTGFFTIWGSMVTFYYTRNDRKPTQP